MVWCRCRSGQRGPKALGHRIELVLVATQSSPAPMASSALSIGLQRWGRAWASAKSLAMDIRQLQYLAALAREKHFTRAAKACNVAQPTLSGRIRQLEQELGVPIVERGQRFHGLTKEGERVLKWAHAILDDWASLQQEISKL